MLNPTILVYERNELIKLVEHHVQTLGPDCNLNHLDVSNIKDMSYVFEHSSFQGDISNWDVSNVTTMRSMFCNSKFNGDISRWNVSAVKDFTDTFRESTFNQDLSKWNLSSAKLLRSMFEQGDFNGDISNWDVSKVVDMRFLFSNSLFKGDVSKWNLYSLEKWSNAFSMHNNSLLGYLCMVENKKYPEELIQDERFMHTIQCVESLDLSVQEAAKYLYLLHTQESVPHVGLHNFSF